MKTFASIIIGIGFIALIGIMICLGTMIYSMWLPDKQSTILALAIGKYVFTCLFIMIFCVFIRVFFTPKSANDRF